MNILYLVEYFYPHSHGGSEWSTYYLIQGIRKKAHNTSVVTPNFGNENDEIWKGITIKRMPFIKKMSKKNPHPISPFWFTNIIFYLTSLLWIVVEVASNKINIIHVQGNYFIPPAVIAGWIFRKPVIVTIRDYQILCPYGFCLTDKRKYKSCSFMEFFTSEVGKYTTKYTSGSILNIIFTYISAIRAWFVKHILSYFLKKATKIVCISKKQKMIFNRNGFLKTNIIYNPMLFNKNPQINKKKNYIIYIGRLTEGKGLLFLLDSFSELVNGKFKTKLVVIGQGYLKDKINNQYRKLIKSGYLKLKGQLQYDEALTLLRNAKVAVVPSLWQEPFGRVALEALSQVTPVIATKRGGLPEIITEGRTGYLINVNKKQLKQSILSALKNEQKLQNNIVNNYSDLKQKFYSNVINSYIKLYSLL